MNIIKLTGVTFALSSALVITSSTLANAQNIQGIVIPKTCSNSYINRGARSNSRSKAVEKALIAWNRIARQRGFFTFKAAKRPKVKVVVYPSNNTQEIIWKANVIGYPCRFISMRRRWYSLSNFWPYDYQRKTRGTTPTKIGRESFFTDLKMDEKIKINNDR